MRREGEDVAGAIVGHLARYDGGHLQRVDDRHCHVYLKPSSTLSRSLRSLGKIGKILGTDFYLTEYDTCQTVAIFYTSYGQSILGKWRRPYQFGNGTFRRICASGRGIFRDDEFAVVNGLLVCIRLQEPLLHLDDVAADDVERRQDG